MRTRRTLAPESCHQSWIEESDAYSILPLVYQVNHVDNTSSDAYNPYETTMVKSKKKYNLYMYDHWGYRLSYMEILLAASKNGNLDRALRAAFSMLILPKQTMPLYYVASRFFVRDKEGKTALDYAALGNHHPLVQTYLFFLIAAACCEKHRRTRAIAWSSDRRTILEWLELLDCFPILEFDKASFEACANSAPSERTRHIFDHTRHDLPKIFHKLRDAVPSGLCWEFDKATAALSRPLSHKEQKSKARNSKPSRPSLKVEDNYDLAYRPEDDESCGDYCESDEELVDCIEGIQGARSMDEDDGRSAAAGVENTDALSVVSSLTLPTLGDFDARTEARDNALDGSSACIDDDDWVDEFSLASSFAVLDAPSAVDDERSKWEVLSEDSSVVIVEGKSYCDALRLGGIPPRTVQSPRKGTASCRKSKATTLQKISEDDSFDEFDSDFIMEGVKQGRGGKPSLRFKGNQRGPDWKAEKHWNRRAPKWSSEKRCYSSSW